MATRDFDRPPIEEPLAELERQLITAFLAGAGHDYQSLVARDDPEAHRLLAEASRYAATRLTEVEARSHYIRQLHGEP
jgi:hypothetical protein